MLNITNNNFAAVQAYNLTVQALNFGTVLGTVSIKNVASVKPLSVKTVRCDAVTTAVRERRTHQCSETGQFVSCCGISSAAFIFE